VADGTKPGIVFLPERHTDLAVHFEGDPLVLALWIAGLVAAALLGFWWMRSRRRR
jgi:hypothetical protein